MDKTNLFIIAIGIIALIILMLSPKIKSDEPLWIKIGNIALYILVLMSILALFRLIIDIIGIL